MWAQDWVNIYDMVAPYPDVESVDVTSSLLRANYSALRMFRQAETFFTSLGLEPMTSDFWNKSMFVRPDDGRQVTCHGSAHDFYTQTDFRYDKFTLLSVLFVQCNAQHWTEYKIIGVSGLRCPASVDKIVTSFMDRSSNVEHRF